MRRTEARQGVRILGGVGPVRGSELSQLEAAELPGIGERTFRRWYPRYEERVTRAYCIAGSARRRASGFPWIGARRRRPHIGRAIKASRRATSTNIWCAITGSPGAAAGPRRYCKAAISCRRRCGVERIAASGRAGQFAVGRHALCWVHAERLVHNLTRSPITSTRRTAGPLRPDFPSTHRLHHARSHAPTATWQQA